MPNIINTSQKYAMYSKFKNINSLHLSNHIHTICNQRNSFRQRIFQSYKDASLKSAINRHKNKIETIENRKQQLE